MPQPTFALSGNQTAVTFGGQALPNGQGTLSNINLNDRKSWFCQAPAISTDTRQLTLGQLVYRGRSVMLARDWGPWKITLPMLYEEDRIFGGNGTTLGTALAAISQAGPQYLSFDSGSTGLLCEFAGAANRKMEVPVSPFLWALELEFQALSSWFVDIASTTSPNALTLNSGSATTFNVTYSGSVWCEPTWTLTIGAGNAAPIASFALTNTTAGETLTITFPGNLAASTAHTIVIDSAAMTATRSQDGTAYDVVGSFVNLYPPAGQVNAMSATLTPASGTATGCTLSGSYQNRWVL